MPWAIKYKSHQNYAGALVNHTYRRLKVGKMAPTWQQKHGGFFISVELRYHALIPNWTCHVNVETLEGDCPIFKDITFEDIAIAGAVRAGDINGFKGDLLQGLSFKNVTFVEKPEQDWTCGYTDLASFSAVDVKPPLRCSSGKARSASGACLAAIDATGCHGGKGCRKCFGCVVSSKGGCAGTKPAEAGCSDEMIESLCNTV